MARRRRSNGSERARQGAFPQGAFPQGAFPLADMHERPPPPLPLLRIFLAGLLGLAILTGAAIGLIRALIDTEAMHQDTLTALRDATGRDVRIAGKLTITSYFSATVAIDGITIANRPGAAGLGAERQDMIRIERAEAELSLLSLLTGRTEIQRLVIANPDITLEIDAEGRGNWQNPPSTNPPTPPITLPRNLHLKDGKLTFTDARSARTTTVALRRVALSEAETGGLLTIAADLAFGPQRFSANGQIGSVARLVDRTATTPWPVRLTLDSPGAKLTIAGGLTRPLDLAGYAVKLDAWVADSSTLANVIPYRLPIMRTMSLTARIADTGGTIPDIAGARLQMGASDLTAWVPGLKVDTADISIPGLDQSARAEILGTLNSVPVRMKAALGPLAVFLPERANTPERFPIDIALELGDTSLAIKGAIGAAGQQTGLDLALSGRVRDLELMSPLIGQRLPALRNVAVNARLTDGETGGFAQSIALRDLSITTHQGDLAADLVLSHTPRWALRGTIRSAKLDADALTQLLAPSIGTIDLVERPSPFRPRALDNTSSISGAKLRLDFLRAADADLTLTIDELRAATLPYRNLAARLRLDRGRLVLDPLTATLPSGPASIQLDIDAADPRTPLRLRATIPGLPIQPLMASTNRRDNLFGTLEIDTDLTAEGDSLRALAATVTGRLGLAIVEGDIDSRVLLDPLAGIMGAARIPLNLATQIGTLSRLRCFAARLDADRGQTRIAALLLESGRVLLEGDGRLDLAQETLDMRIRSSIRIPGQAVSVPSRLEGSFAAPRMALDTPDPAYGAAIARPDAPDSCLPALELARAGRPGPLPAGRDARPAMVTPTPVRPRR